MNILPRKESHCPMRDVASIEEQLESLAARLLELASQQEEALIKGDVDALNSLSRQRQETFQRLNDTLAKASAQGYGADSSDGFATHRQRLGDIARQVLETDRRIQTLAASATRQSEADLEKVRLGRLALNYRRRSGLSGSSRVDLVR